MSDFWVSACLVCLLAGVIVAEIGDGRRDPGLMIMGLAMALLGAAPLIGNFW